jgi:hypothetical protein
VGSTCAVVLLTTILTITRTNVGEHWWMSDSGMQLFMRFPNGGEGLRAHEFGLWHRTVRVRARSVSYKMSRWIQPVGATR